MQFLRKDKMQEMKEKKKNVVLALQQFIIDS